MDHHLPPKFRVLDELDTLVDRESERVVLEADLLGGDVTPGSLPLLVLAFDQLEPGLLGVLELLPGLGPGNARGDEPLDGVPVSLNPHQILGGGSLPDPAPMSAELLPSLGRVALGLKRTE